MLLIDIDDTVITTKNKFTNPVDKLKEAYKDGSIDIVSYENLLSSWRLERKVILTDQAWPNFLHERQQNGNGVFALTRVNTGKSGLIESMERWRNDELKSMGINFTLENPMDGIDYEEPQRLGVEDASFFKGIFFTGQASKREVVQKILESKKYDLVILVDDKLEQLEDVATACDICCTEFIPIQFIVQGCDEVITTELEEKILDVINQ